MMLLFILVCLAAIVADIVCYCEENEISINE